MAQWWLESGEARADQYDSFEIPPKELRENLKKGMYIKAIFAFASGGKERMWIEVTDIETNGYVGKLLSVPVTVSEQVLSAGTEIRFESHHVIDVDDPEES